jgi:carbon storage regulator
MMLVLSRKKDESILVDDKIKITVLDIRGDKVRIGIEAPREMAVHREEVFAAIKRQDAEKAK